jgi:NADH:ubiquinone oxidoreductase subunit 4 (subunit M)
LKLNETAALAVIVVLVFVIGLYPKLFLDISKETTEFILQKAEIRTIIK